MLRSILSLAFLYTLLISCNNSTAKVQNSKTNTTKEESAPQVNNPNNAIQLALLLDVSNSMDGLIDQAKSELWGVVNEVNKAKKNNKEADIMIALYAYGNDGYNAETGYVKKITDFTNDLDKISEDLFSLSTNGGSEFCGQVIGRSVKDLDWLNTDAYKVIFIAGNEPFTQGKMNYQISCENAKSKEIFVNTIHCGTEAEGIQTKWKHGATLANGEYFFINSNSIEKYYESPYDAEIEKLNNSLNDTYWGYGNKAESKKNNQALQDANNATVTKKAYFERVKSKSSSKMYEKSTYEWDVTTRSKTDDKFLEQAKDEELPKELKGKSITEKKTIIVQNSAKRDSINAELKRLNELRDKFVTAQKVKDATTSKDKSLGYAISEAIHKQAKLKGFSF